MKKGFTLVEAMVVTLIFSLLFGITLTILATSDRSWRLGQSKLTEQQEARKAMDNIARLLRQSNPDWLISETHYPVTITEEGKRIDFYQPVFDAEGMITSLKKITFKLDPNNLEQLLKKEGTANQVVVATEIETINFGGGCSGCSAFNCSSVADDCPVVSIEVKTKKETEFTLYSEITLRNAEMALEGDVGVEEPGEGEF